MAKLQIDDQTEIVIEQRVGAEGEVAGVAEEAKLKLVALVDDAKKIMQQIRSGLQGVGVKECELELGFTAGHNVWVLSAQGSIKLTIKWVP